MIEKIAYYPGCTAKSYAKYMNYTSQEVMKKLGYELVELERWNCCGTFFGLTEDDLTHQLAPIRNLIRVREGGFTELTTTCSMCYNTIKRANILFKADQEKADRLNAFMYREEDYEGDVRVFHLLELLRDRVDFERVLSTVEKPLTDLKIAPYYGCALLRPLEASIDANPEQPSILSDLIHVLGGEAIESPYMNECCGAYATVKNKGIVAERVYKILNSMAKRGADVVMVSCPLCHFNLDRRQKEAKEKHLDLPEVPVLYFTQLMALAFGIDSEKLGFQEHYINPSPVLERKKILEIPKKASIKVKK